MHTTTRLHGGGGGTDCMGGGGKCTNARGTHSARRADLHPQSNDHISVDKFVVKFVVNSCDQASVGSSTSASGASASVHHQSLRPLGMAQELCQAEISTLSAKNHQFAIHTGNLTRCSPCIQRRHNPHSCVQLLFAGTTRDPIDDLEEGAQPDGFMPGNPIAVDTVDDMLRYFKLDSDGTTDAATLEVGMARYNLAALHDEETWMAAHNAAMTDICKVP